MSDVGNPYAAPGSDLATSTDGAGAGVAPYTVGEMRAAFRRFAWAYWSYIGSSILMIIGLVALVVTMVVASGAPRRGREFEALFEGENGMVFAILFMGMVLLMVAISILLMVFSLILLYRYWRVMQPYTTRTTPGKAVGFLFIPFYNLYWMFVAYHGLAKEIDAYIASHPGTEAPRPETSLILVMVIMMVMSFVPYLGSLAGLGLIVLFYISKMRLNNSIIGIIADRARGDVTAADPR